MWKCQKHPTASDEEGLLYWLYIGSYSRNVSVHGGSEDLHPLRHHGVADELERQRVLRESSRDHHPPRSLFGLTSRNDFNHQRGFHTHLHKRMEDLQDLFLDEDGEDGAVHQQLADELLDSGQEDLHGRQQRLPLVCLPVPETNIHA